MEPDLSHGSPTFPPPNPNLAASPDDIRRQQDNARKREWARRNPAKRRASRLRYLYGVSAEMIEARLKAQSGLCSICQKRPATDVDHNHKTGEVRGILCAGCNRALGGFHEDRDALARAIDYINFWSKPKFRRRPKVISTDGANI